MWHKVWSELEKPHSHYRISDDDFCIYAREYISKASYQGGQTNSLILNFKKPPSAKGTTQWEYRDRAIKTFSKEVELLFRPDSQATIQQFQVLKPKMILNMIIVLKIYLKNLKNQDLI